MASAAKRARTEAPESYRKLDLEALSLKKIEGRETPIYLTVVDGHMPEFILTPEEPTVLLRGFDFSGKKEKRSFNSDEGKGNSLSLYVQLDEEQADFLKKASNRIKTEFEAEGEVEWAPMFGGEKYSTYAVGIDVVLAGQENSLTHIRVKKGEEKHAGTGWAFLKEMAGERGTFKGSEAMFVVKFRAWRAVVNGVTKAGLKLVATQLALKVPERKFVDVLPDW